MEKPLFKTQVFINDEEVTGDSFDLKQAKRIKMKIVHSLIDKSKKADFTDYLSIVSFVDNINNEFASTSFPSIDEEGVAEINVKVEHYDERPFEFDCEIITDPQAMDLKTIHLYNYGEKG